MLAAAVAAPGGFLTRPRKVTKPLAAEAPLLFDFESLHPSNAMLVDHKAIVEQPLCRFLGVEPDAHRAECPQHFVSFLQPGDIFNSEPALLEVVLFHDLLDSSFFVSLKVQSSCWYVMYNCAESWFDQLSLVA
jgi:hypothetical protein